jgi:hypothetical protein
MKWLCPYCGQDMTKEPAFVANASEIRRQIEREKACKTYAGNMKKGKSDHMKTSFVV